MGKILLVGETPSITSGFANVLRHIAAHLVKKGYKVEQLGWCQNKPLSPNTFGYKVHPVPGLHDYYGITVFDGIVRDFQPDVVLSIGDVYAVEWIPFSSTRPYFTWISLITIDSAPLPLRWLKCIEDMDYPVVCSKYGTNVLKSEQLEAYYVPYGVDHSVFYPQNKRRVRERNDINPDAFILLYVGVNSFRKQVPRLLEAFKLFSEGKDDVILYLHTSLIQNKGKEGWYLGEFIKRMGLIDKVMVAEKAGFMGIPENKMNVTYNIADVFVSPASCEGFGLPFIEAAACKVPSIAVKYSAMEELLEEELMCRASDWYYHSPYGMIRALIDVEDMASKMELVYRDRKFLADCGEKAYRKSLEYSWNKVLPKYEEIIVKALESGRKVTKKEFQGVFV